MEIRSSLGLTDETFAVSALHKKEAHKENSKFFYLALILTAYFSWVAGSFAGALLGEIIPKQLSDVWALRYMPCLLACGSFRQKRMANWCSCSGQYVA